MVPNGSAYSNYPSFANNGTKTPPGGSTESAKYALGMVPADTFPAEWANYLFHGATAGITRLNADTGSIKKEINTVLSNFNITPDATLNNQLMEALTKLKAEAALAAHPVGSLYWTSVNENPAVTFGGGTWVQIKDRFILAAGDTYSNAATGGAATVTLTVDQMPNHRHAYEPTGSIVGGSYTFKGTSSTTGDDYPDHTHNYVNTVISLSENILTSAGVGSTGIGYINDTQTSAGANARHAHNYTPTGTIEVSTNPEFVGNGSSTNYEGGGQAHNNMPPYIGKYCWERTA